MSSLLKWLLFFLLLNKTLASPVGSKEETSQLDVEPETEAGRDVAAIETETGALVDGDRAADDDDDDDDGAPDSADLAGEPADDKKDDDDDKDDEATDAPGVTTDDDDDDKDDKSDGDKDDDDDDDDDIMRPKPVEDEDEEEEDDTEYSPDDVQTKYPLIVIMASGLSSDLVKRHKKLKTFEHIKENGVHAEHVTPVFPSNPFPNSYSILTGKYPGNHGMVNDYMYDPVRRDLFLATSEPESKHWWNKAEPIWTTAAKYKKDVHISWWRGCEVEISKRRPKVCEPWDKLDRGPNLTNFVEEQFEEIVAAIEREDYDLIMVSYDVIASVAREYGPEHRKTARAIGDFDAILGELLKELDEKNLEDKVNIVVLSDHGMVSATRSIKLERALELNEVDKVVGEGAFVMIQPEKGKNEFVYQQLLQGNNRGLNVYKRNALPKRFHLKQSDRMLPIILTADKGYFINTPKIKTKVYPDDEDDEEVLGYHGYDAEHVSEMNSIMYGIGPDFRKNYTADAFRQVDHYNLLCHLVGIKAKPNDGVWGRVQKMLKSEEPEEDDDEDSSEETDDDDDDDNGVASSLSLSMVLIMSIVSLRALLCFE
ncbi:Glycerophosphocholine cholinephosphodiesterase ENPP6 [Halotydeus destructor]|nr:Glycerophosphocholine cholinephosphodiesterase ENPP6 [Halotydeus destructor]